MAYGIGLLSGFRADTTRTSTNTHERYRSRTAERADTAQEALQAAQRRFQVYAKAWRDEVNIFSSISEIITNENYVKIISMGEIAVKFILEDLKNGPDHWYYALSTITGADPAENEPEGDLEACCDAWLRWGRQSGII